MLLRERSELKEYQNRAVRFLLEHDENGMNKALWLDMGLGKTVVTLTAIQDLKDRGELQRPALIVGTIRIIYSVWRQEAKRWKHTRRLRFSLVHGTLQERLAALRKPADVYLINYENLKWLAQCTPIDRPNFSIFVSDESSRLKAHNTKRFAALRGDARRRRPGLLELFDRRWLLTGTPAPNSLMDVWAQIYILDEGQRLGRDFAFFKQRFFEMSEETIHSERPSYQPRPGARQRIQRLIAPLVMRLDAADYVKMPPVIPNVIPLELPPDLRQMYDDMERRMFLELDKINVEIFNAASLTAKCWQFANGALYGIERENGTERGWQQVHDLKLQALDEVLEEADGNPVLVPYWFQSDHLRLHQFLAKRFKHGVPTIGKGVKPAAADKLVVQWNKGKLPILLVHYITAAHGLNLQAGGHHIFKFSQTWSLELHDQIIARLARQGQEHPVMVHYPRVRNTVDEAMADAIHAKSTNQRGLLNALRRYRAARELIG
jgi:SNF2 family DNA or RNA helicase